MPAKFATTPGATIGFAWPPEFVGWFAPAGVDEFTSGDGREPVVGLTGKAGRERCRMLSSSPVLRAGDAAFGAAAASLTLTARAVATPEPPDGCLGAAVAAVPVNFAIIVAVSRPTAK
jgi:hypothetical protein